MEQPASLVWGKNPIALPGILKDALCGKIVQILTAMYRYAILHKLHTDFFVSKYCSWIGITIVIDCINL